MSLTASRPIPLSAPSYLLRDAVWSDARRHREAPSKEVDGLVQQYDCACGYTFAFGHIIERIEARSETDVAVVLSVVPLQLWEDNEDERAPLPWSIADWLDRIEGHARPSLAALPQGLYVAGGLRGGARVSHELMSFIILDLAQEAAIRRWLDDEFLGRLWPRLTELLQRRVRQIARAQVSLQGRVRSATSRSWQAPAELQLVA